MSRSVWRGRGRCGVSALPAKGGTGSESRAGSCCPGDTGDDGSHPLPRMSPLPGTPHSLGCATFPGCPLSLGCPFFPGCPLSPSCPPRSVPPPRVSPKVPLRGTPAAGGSVPASPPQRLQLGRVVPAVGTAGTRGEVALSQGGTRGVPKGIGGYPLGTRTLQRDVPKGQGDVPNGQGGVPEGQGCVPWGQ